MKRLWRVPEPNRLLNILSPTPKPQDLTKSRRIQTQPEQCSIGFSCVIGLFADKGDSKYWEDVRAEVALLRLELVDKAGDRDEVARVLRDRGVRLFMRHYTGGCFVELMKQLQPLPDLALEVFNWRLNKANLSIPLTSEEYAKGITLAGRMHNVDLALELFNEATNKRIKRSSIYNALMGAYMFNGQAEKCQQLFRDLKRDPDCCPTIVTYNILISVFGRLMLIDHMEATYHEIVELNLYPNISTYNNLIAGYITAWMWDSMEKFFKILEASDVEPDISTLSLMLRGYAHSGELEKMELMYHRLNHQFDWKDITLIRVMIHAYCRSSDSNRVKKIESLLSLISNDEYRPWLNVLLIRLYAQENLLEEMENLINKAFERKTFVSSANVMRYIVSVYFRSNAVEKLVNFGKRAELSGWIICRALYHCKMVMFASENRLSEMENVLDEMADVNLARTEKTFWILYKAYLLWGQKYKAELVRGLMCKCGYEILLEGDPAFLCEESWSL